MSRTRSLAILAGSVVGLVTARSAHAQISWNNPSGGTWHSAGNWNPANEPDNAGEDAQISIPGFYTVSLTSSRTIRDLLFFNSDAALTINNGSSLSVTGANCITDGSITINPTGGGSATSLSLAAGTTLSGIGDTILNATSGFLDRAYVFSPSQLLWTNDFGHVIRGRGRLYYSFTNNGTLRADVAGSTLETLQSTVFNNGFIEATNGATFHLNSNTVNQSGGGQISISDLGSTLSMSGATITAGSISAANGGRIVSSAGGQSWFGPISLSGPLDILNGTSISLTGTLSHSGNITINSTGGSSATWLSLATGATLTGPGSVTLNATSGFLDRAQLFSASQTTWTNAAGHTVNGTGRVYYSFVNNGLVAASAPGETLELRQGTVTNNASIQTQNGGILLLNSQTISQSASGSLAASNGNINLSSAIISGGTINSSGSSKVISASGTQTFTGNPTLNATLDISNGSTVSFTSSITHNGVATINPTGGGSVSDLTVSAGTTLDGSGTVVLNATSNFLERARLYAPSQAAWTHGPNHTIRGRGQIYYNLINNGSIIADVASQTLQLLNGTVTNNASIQTQNGGILLLTSETISQSASGSLAASNGNINLSNAIISGGTINSSGSSKVISASGTQTFTGNPTLNATLDISDGSTVSFTSSITHNGVATINPTGGGSVTNLFVSAGTTLDGSGTVVLNATSNFLDRARLYAPSQAVWTHGTNHSIRGRGQIFYSLINNGLIAADVANQTLQLLSGTVTNNATIETQNGGILLLTSETINQSASGLLSASSGDVRLSSAIISGGTLASSGPSKVVATSSTSTLTGGVLVTGMFHINDGTSISCPTGLNHTGSLIVNATSGGSVTTATFGPGSIISGTGNLILNATSGFFDRAYLYAPTGTMTNANGHTISGTGNVYATWTNRGIVRPSAPSREIACQQGTFTQAPEGTLHIELGGLSAGQFGRLTGPQPKVLGGTLSVSLTNGFFPPCGSTYTIISGPISGTFSTLSLPQVPVGAMNVLYGANSVILAYLPSDYNNDGFVDGFDYDDYVQCFEGIQCLPGKTADFNNDGFADGFDYDDFVRYFEQGC